jgi:predicted acyl esterase
MTLSPSVRTVLRAFRFVRKAIWPNVLGDLFSGAEAQDYDDLIEWAGIQAWSSARVGLHSASHLAISPYKVAALQLPHLLTIYSWEGLSEVYRDFARPGGFLENGFSKLWSWLRGKEACVQNSLYKAIVEHMERDDWYQARTPRLGSIPTLNFAASSRPLR